MRNPTDFGLFAPEPAPTVRVPDIRTPPPSAPGSETSRMVAEAIDGPFRSKCLRRVMPALASVYPNAMTREELAARTGYRESGLCARLFELRPVFVDVIDGGGKTTGGMTVDTYRLSEVGAARVRSSGIPTNQGA